MKKSIEETKKGLKNMLIQKNNEAYTFFSFYSPEKPESLKK